MKVRFFTQEQYHNKKDVGSTRIRVHNLIKYWPDAAIYKYGENPDVLIFQKVYITEDYKFPEYFENIAILDICDPDHLSGAFLKETANAMDGIVVPSEDMRLFMQQLTDKPVKIIKDRFDLEGLPRRKRHEGPVKELVWFGYHSNAELLRPAMPVLEQMKLRLTVISDQDIEAWRWASHDESKALGYKNLYTYKNYNQDTIYKDIQKADICLLPKGFRPQDRFKSENKTIMANLAGLPVATEIKELNDLIDGPKREKASQSGYLVAKDLYDCTLSVKEYILFIDELKELRVNRGQQRSQVPSPTEKTGPSSGVEE